MPSPSSAPAIFYLLVAAASHVGGISVPTGKDTPITPARVTPRPTYHPPSAHPAPVHEYTYENPEPAPLDPSWVQTPVKYLNVLRPNSIFYVPVRIPNPAAHQSPYYYSIASKEQTKDTQQPSTGVYQDKQQTNTGIYQTQQTNTGMYQTQQPTVEVYLAQQQPASSDFQTQQPTVPVYQPQRPAVAVYQTQQSTVTAYQPQQPTVTAFQTQQPTITAYQPTVAQQTASQQNEKPSSPVDTTVYQKETDSSAHQKDADKPKEFGAKIAPKQKWKKPQYYLPKGQGKQSTKTGYPKKAIAQPSENYYYYYPITVNNQ